MVVDTRKSIKIERPVYERLDAVRGKGETFSQVIERLLSVVEDLRAIPLGPRPDSIPQEYRHGPEKIRDLQVR